MQHSSSSSSLQQPNLRLLPSSSSQQRQQQRHAGYDNCKYVFIFFVVLWHLLNNFFLEESIREWSSSSSSSSVSLSSIITWLFRQYTLFHEKFAIPGFAFLSGLFGKSYIPPINEKAHDDTLRRKKQQAKASRGGGGSSGTKKSTSILSLYSSDPKMYQRWKNSIATLFFGPLCYQLVCLLGSFFVNGFVRNRWMFDTSINNGTVQILLWDHLHTWYLFALFLWRMSTPIIMRCQYPIMTSLAFSFLHTRIDLSMPAELRMRVFHFFPYYVAGLSSTEETFTTIVTTLLPGTSPSASSSSSTASTTTTSSLSSSSKLIGWIGISMSFCIHMLLPEELQSHIYQLDELQFIPCVMFFLQYIFCSISFLSIIFIVKQYTKPFVGTKWYHDSSTLAIYMWHWQIVNFITGGTCFFSTYVQCIEFPTPIVKMMNNLPILVAIIELHCICLVICLILGNPFIWRICLRHITQPNIDWLFHNESDLLNPTTNNKNNNQEDGDDEERIELLVMNSNDNNNNNANNNDNNKSIGLDEGRNQLLFGQHQHQQEQEPSSTIMSLMTKTPSSASMISRSTSAIATTTTTTTATMRNNKKTLSSSSSSSDNEPLGAPFIVLLE